MAYAHKFGTQDDRSAVATGKILDATITLIAERGVDGFSIGDVAQRAAVSRGLPVHYYKTREGLVAAAARRLFEGNLAACSIAPDAGEMLEILMGGAGGSRTADRDALAALSGVTTESEVKTAVTEYWRAVVAKLASAGAVGDPSAAGETEAMAWAQLSAALGHAILVRSGAPISRAASASTSNAQRAKTRSKRPSSKAVGSLPAQGELF